ncbi:MAG: VRR-NUC domain-containing protein [Candidatus Latescibacteria bacterium]|nr:VRR-NUC domain-containing protein [Candidatus Latescibacterota bacterium]
MRKKSPPFKPDESTLQSQIVELLSRLADKGRFSFFSVPNENKFLSLLPKNIAIAITNKLKAMGMVPGAADLCVVQDGRIYFMEVKTEKGRQSANQKLFQTAMIEVGAKYILVRSVNEALLALKFWNII